MIVLKKLLVLLGIILFGITVKGQFIVEFRGDVTSGCDSLTVHFSDLTTASNITNHLWEFGDNTTSNDTNPTHTYTQPGFYSVKLTITRVVGGITQVVPKIKTAYIKVHDTPTADFSINDSIFSTSFTVLFTNTSQPDSTEYDYLWNFGDTDTSTSENKIHYYRAEGTYPVLLKITSEFGCWDTVQKSVTVVSRFKIPNIFSPNNDGKNDEFIITASGAQTYLFEVYNRWGDKVYSVSAKSIRWDGRNGAGLMLTPGLYYYILKPAAGSEYKGCLELVY